MQSQYSPNVVRNITLGAAAWTEVAAPNANRRYMLVQNLDAAVMYISLGSALSGAAGILLTASGGAFEMNATNLYLGRVFAYSAGGGDISVVELS